ncbi:TIR domain-containing protein [Methyloversatilis sp. XJ19-49]|uniref:TIR domain-containing protein n=1 Tax=Methyloversatilis sp. XJ19-49 TaxID=2963429 RepID=UPI00211BBB7D|nr:TIR domain-containing protein [Methyloversatilis sp. XJ19-49]MCQ9377661.1 TIR domain-containing protein [Methyloversatilis sp. XJ19-49]
MTYAIALCLETGVVLMSDSRMNAGLDAVSSFSKMRTWAHQTSTGSTLVALMHAGNLAAAQRVLDIFGQRFMAAAKLGTKAIESDSPAASLSDVATELGGVIREVAAEYRAMVDPEIAFNVSFLLAGKIGGERHRVFLVYSQGNFIEATEETPYLQVGETKYGKSIVDQVVTRASSLSDGVQACLLSAATAVRYNLAVAPPFDLAILNAKRPIWIKRTIKEDDQRYLELVRDWNEGSRMLFAKLPPAVNIESPDVIDVFLSYSSKDRALAKALAERLTTLGFVVWWDTELLAGETFRSEILARLEAAKSVVVIWSHHSIGSAFVVDEAERARRQDKLIPLRASDLSSDDLPLGFGQLQTIPITDEDTLVRSLAALGISSG